MPVPAAPTVMNHLAQASSQTGLVNPELAALLAQHVSRLTTSRTVTVPAVVIEHPAVEGREAIKSDKRKGIEAQPAIEGKAPWTEVVSPERTEQQPPIINGLDIDLTQRFAAVCLVLTHGTSSDERTGAPLGAVVKVPGTYARYHQCDCYGVSYGSWTTQLNALCNAGLLVRNAPNPGSGRAGKVTIFVTEFGAMVWLGKSTFGAEQAVKAVPMSNTGKVATYQQRQSAVTPPAGAAKLS